jgi:hypothetical protein
VTVRSGLAGTLGLATLAVIAGSGAWAWASFDFWETAPVLGSTFLAGLSAGSALFVQTRRVPSAVILGFLVGAANLVVAATVTVTLWTR